MLYDLHYHVKKDFDSVFPCIRRALTQLEIEAEARRLVTQSPGRVGAITADAADDKTGRLREWIYHPDHDTWTEKVFNPWKG